jgi:hypothetical protein
MKKWHCGSEQTKRHLRLMSFAPQTGQSSHHSSAFSFGGSGSAIAAPFEKPEAISSLVSEFAAVDKFFVAASA